MTKRVIIDFDRYYVDPGVGHLGLTTVGREGEDKRK